MIKQSFKLFRQSYRLNSKGIRPNLILAILLEFVAVGLLYLLNRVYGQLYQGIQVYDTAVIWKSIGTFTMIAMVLVLVNGYMGFFINRLAFEIRTGLTMLFFNTPSYQIDSVNIINLDQRVQEDFKKFGESACDFWFAVLKSALHLPVFLGVIISLTHWYTGMAVVLAVIAGTYLTKLVARKMIVAQSVQETNEALFRKQLTVNGYTNIMRQFRILNNQFKKLSFTQSGLSQVFVLLPFMILMPMYISHAIAMGAFFQAVNALGKIIDSLSILIDSRQVMVNIETCLFRLKDLSDRMGD